MPIISTERILSGSPKLGDATTLFWSPVDSQFEFRDYHGRLLAKAGGCEAYAYRSDLFRETPIKVRQIHVDTRPQLLEKPVYAILTHVGEIPDTLLLFDAKEQD